MATSGGSGGNKLHSYCILLQQWSGGVLDSPTSKDDDRGLPLVTRVAQYAVAKGCMRYSRIQLF